MRGLFAPARHTCIAAMQAFKLSLSNNVVPVKFVSEEQPKDGKSVDRTLDERGGGRLREVAGGYRHFSDAQPEFHELRHNLLIEDEVIRIHLRIHTFQRFPAIRSITCVVFRERQTEYAVLHSRKEAIR